MAAANRARKSTIESSMETIKLLGTRIEPPVKLNDTERAHFDRTISSRELSTWSPHDLTIAVQLAKTLVRLEAISAQLENDGLMLENQKGTQIAHPLLNASMTMASTVQALTRTLGLGASQRALAGSDQKGRNQAEAKARAVIDKARDDSLLA